MAAIVIGLALLIGPHVAFADSRAAEVLSGLCSVRGEQDTVEANHLDAMVRSILSEQHVERRAALIYICAKYEIPDAETRGILNARWDRRLLAEAFYTPPATPTSEFPELLIHSYQEIRAPVGIWEIDPAMDKWVAASNKDSLERAFIDQIMSDVGMVSLIDGSTAAFDRSQLTLSIGTIGP
jgi:hypothetical protein